MLSIKIGETYNCYDDGKVKPSRKHKVLITDIIKFSDIDKDILDLWKEEVEYCDWLYAKETDYFIKGTIHIHKEDYETVYFVRTLNDGGWFAFGDNSGGRLDVQNTISLKMYEYLYNSIVSEKGRLLNSFNELVEENKKLIEENKKLLSERKS